MFTVDKQLKLTEYHEEQNRKEGESNKRMPKATAERFKEQAERLREARRQHDLTKPYNADTNSKK